MTCVKLFFPGSLRSHFRVVQLTVKPQVRSVSHGVFRTDLTPRSAHSLSSRCVTFMPAVYLRPCSVRHVSSSGSGWYESVADSAAVHVTEQLLISSQQMTALPWWAGIVCTTLALRTVVTLPLAVYQAIIIAKVSSNTLTTHLLYLCRPAWCIFTLLIEAESFLLVSGKNCVKYFILFKGALGKICFI